MFTFIVIIHVIACLLLIAIVLMQSGRGGGLTESFAAAESIFGTKTNSFLVRATSFLAIIFLFTCIGLAIFSTQRSRSLLELEAAKPETTPPVSQSNQNNTAPQNNIASKEIPKQEK